MKIRVLNVHSSIYVLRYDDKPIYVGQTRMSVKQRIRQHFIGALCGSESRAPKLYPFIQENPEIERYEVEVLESVPTTMADDRERYWVSHFDTLIKGMNCTDGGTPYGNDHYLAGMRMPPEVIQASINARKGKKLSDEHRKKISVSNLNTVHKNRRAVVREDGVEYRSLVEAATMHRINKAAISAAIRMGRKSAGYKWRYSDEEFKPKPEGRRKAAVICNETGVEYESMAKAAADVGCTISNISMHIRGFTKRVKGLTFRRAKPKP